MRIPDRLLIAAPPLFLLVWVVLGAVTPGYSFLTGHGSDLALGPYGVVMALNFIVVGALVAVLGVSRLRDGQRVVGALVIVAGLGILVSGIFPEDRAGAQTASGAIHNAAFGVVELAILAAAVAAAVLGRGGWRLYSALTAVAILALTAVFLTVGSERGDPLYFVSGLIQLALVAVGFGWLAVLAARGAQGRRAEATG